LEFRIKLVLVYLGKPPQYVISNLNYLHDAFPNYELVLIVDECLAEAKLLNSQVCIWTVPKIESEWVAVSSLIAHDTDFRNNFWFKTVARFYALLHYLENNANSSILHIEADVWLSPHFPMKSLESLGETIAFPLKSHSEGIASTFYVGNLDLLRGFISFCESEFRNNPYSTDVSILGNYGMAEFSNFVNLPNGVMDSEYYRGDLPIEVQSTLSKNFEVFQGIFDASTLGIWFTGVDPRNENGFRTLFKQQHHPIRCDNLNLFVEGNHVYILCNFRRYEIYSLHVHSKDTRMFGVETWKVRLKQISAYDSSRVKYEFIPGVTLNYFIRYVIYRTKLVLRQLQGIIK
jgi:hypothetical protein